ncbi:YozE family protein [Desemzia sp. RIT804]|uniref:YozE family protein n=1 Tax=Desemzia sp. RIT 804 TaxID=2810209 RepID=UPI0019520A1E|nr:YozE family protein [Desemzia sp. RIT 804]MBM6613753.1 YozE family protein [Desemzia sp. RIT 804]
MTRTFYQYLMTERDADMKDPITIFANSAYRDTSFPKQSKDYHEISHYLEMYGSYLETMTIFDEAWERYLATKK